MAKRLLDCTASELAAFSKKDLLESMAGCEGRVMVSETIGITQPLLNDVTNAEYAAALGADVLLLNMFDVQQPVVQALPKVAPEETVRELKRLTGRVIGINLEPVDPVLAASNDGTLWQMSAGRLATSENAVKAADMGVDMVLLTGNPGNGVANEAIVAALREMKAAAGDRLILAAGKMHGAGILSQSGASIMTLQDAQEFIDAGADIVLVPAPGTVPGITVEAVHELASYVHSRGALLMTAIGTSQEGADTATIRQIALWCKMAGADLHHIGDTGVPGMALPQNILAYSITIRGERHTYHRMASSINR